eukprot:63109-Amphidinium_carterae.1
MREQADVGLARPSKIIVGPLGCILAHPQPLSAQQFVTSSQGIASVCALNPCKTVLPSEHGSPQQCVIERLELSLRSNACSAKGFDHGLVRVPSGVEV